MLAIEDGVTCWIDPFVAYLFSQGTSFPVADKGEFEALLWAFANGTEIGGYHYSQNNIGFIDERLVFMRYTVRSAGGILDPYSLKHPRWEAWDEERLKFNAGAPLGINKVTETAGLDWCLMITEIRLVETMR